MAFQAGNMYGIEIDYKELVLEIMDRVERGKASMAMLELRMTLFVAATHSENYAQCLRPFPPCFFNSQTKTQDINALRGHIQSIPALKNLNVDTETQLPPATWELIYWVFTNPLTITPRCNSDFDRLNYPNGFVGMIQEKTKLQIPRLGYFAFEVTVPNPKPAFVEGRAKYGSYFAFHGSPLSNFHSIIHRGLLSSLNRRSAYGPGTYLSSSLEVSQEYSLNGVMSGSRHGHFSAWNKSMFGEYVHCLAICEVVDDPSGLKKYKYHGHLNRNGSTIPAEVTVVTNDDYIQHAYLLLFSSKCNLTNTDWVVNNMSLGRPT